AFIKNDTTRMTRELDAARARPEGAWASNWQARIAAFGGHLHAAHEGFRRGVATTIEAGLGELAGGFSAQDAIAHAAVGQWARALELPAPVPRVDHAPVSEFWPTYLRGKAQLELGRHSEAANEFRSIIDHRGELADSPLFSLAHLGLARALASAGDPAAARQA